MKTELLNYINRHLDQKISLNDLAKLTGYSPFHLHHKISEELAEPLGNFIKRQRIKTAAYLLVLTYIPIAEIKYLVGYDNDSAFSKAFKSIMGISPKQYRMENQFKQKMDDLPSRYLSFNTKIVRFTRQKALLFSSLGDYFSPQTYRFWEDVRIYMQENQLSPADFEYYTILYVCQNVSGGTRNRIDAALIPKKPFDWQKHKFLQGEIPESKFVSYKLCCSIPDFQSTSLQVMKHLLENAYQHGEGVSLFKYAEYPNFQQSDTLLIDWLIPIE